MYPYLFELGSIRVETYGVIVVLAYGMMVAFAARTALGMGIDRRRLVWVVAWASIGTLVGGRLTYLVVNLDWVMSRPSIALAFWEGGIVSVGGIVGMHAGVAIYSLVSKLPLGRVLDVAAMSGALSMIIGRWGCFFAGCDYGVAASDLPWAITFTDPESLVPASLLGVPLHPVQLYLSAANLVSFVSGYVVFRVCRRAGSAFGATAASYSLLRFFLEFLRGDPDRGVWLGGFLSTAQVFSLVWLLVGIVSIITAGRGLWNRGNFNGIEILE